MIKVINLKNFKSIKNNYFQLRKLNILLGLNGSGKTTFIQSLLLLKQSQHLANGRIDLQFPGNEYVNLGTTKDVRYQYSKKDENVTIGLQFDHTDLLDIEFDYQIESEIMFVKNKDFIKSDNFTNGYLTQLLFNENFQYLNTNRTPPKSIHSKSHSNVVRQKNIGKYGEFTVHYIETYHGDEIGFENLLHKLSFSIDEVTGKNIVNKTLINQINLWMGEISPGVNIKTTTISSEEIKLEYAYKQPNFGNTNNFKPENVGFGISYVLPVVTALLAIKPGQLLIIENPESHIHPRGQAELGKLIALAAMNDVQIIIETHSDHILNGIRVAVKENNLLKDDIILFYFDKNITDSEQYSKITDIEIDKNGSLSEYPDNLLDEWSNQLSKLF